jgi:hypothetical protein
LFFDLQGGRRGRIAAVGKERLRLEPGSVETFNDWKGFADVGPSGAVHFAFGVAARLGNMEVVSGTFMSARRVRIIRGLKRSSFALLLRLHLGRLFVGREFALFGKEASQQLIGLKREEFLVFLEENNKLIDASSRFLHLGLLLRRTESEPALGLCCMPVLNCLGDPLKLILIETLEEYGKRVREQG